MVAGLLTGAMTRARATALPDNDWRSTNPELKEPRLSRDLALVDTLIVGFRTPAQVDGILPAAALVLTEDDVRKIKG